jgi:hypothetical protein
LVVALLLYLPLIFFGYGSDVDTFRVLDAGRNFMATADYVPSRRPGYLVFEMAAYGLDQAGGSLLVNLGTLFWGLTAVGCFLRICRRRAWIHAELLALIFAVHPLFWYNASLSNDYIWALGMLMAGFDLIEEERLAWAGVAVGLAAGCRISSVIVTAALLVYAWMLLPQKRRQVAAAAGIALLTGCLAYVLPWDFSEWRLSFWQVSSGAAELWTPWMQAGRFFYKNLYFWGIPAAAYLIFLLFRTARGYKTWMNPDRLRLVVLSVLVVLGIELLFFRYPIEVEYLLPILPFCLILVGIGLPSKRLLISFCILVVLYGFINFNIAQPNQPGQASRATTGLWLEPGYILQEMKLRIALIGCDSHACYDERVAARTGMPEE